MSSPLRALAAPIYIPSLIYSIGNGALQPVIVLAALDIGFSEAGSSAVLGVSGVVGVFTAPMLGSFITKVGDRRSLVIASVLALFALATSLSALLYSDTSYAKVAFISGIVAIAISLNVWTLARQAYIADSLPGMWRGRGLSTLGGVLRIGVLVGPLLSTALIALWGLSSVFVMNGVTVAISLALILRYLTPVQPLAGTSSIEAQAIEAQAERVEQQEREEADEQALLDAHAELQERAELVELEDRDELAGQEGQPRVEPAVDVDDLAVIDGHEAGEPVVPAKNDVDDAMAERPSSGRHMPSDSHPLGVPRPDLRSTIIAGIGITSLTVLRANKNVIIPLWGTALGLDHETITLAFAASALIDTIMFYPAGKMADRRGRLWALLPSLIIMSFAIGLMVTWSTAVGFFVGSILLGFGNGFGSGILMTLGADLSPSQNRATFLGYWQAIANSGTAAGPFVVSGLTALIGVAAGLWATAALGLFGAVWFRALLPGTYRRLGLTLRGMPLEPEDTK
ncbi:MAG: MFS transporter [Flaviflexus sp.]|uniref:MFS transporter n=1 Tax=Flaviflexus sp. TaxID=1969482 RepID=UPI00352DD53D